MFLQHMLSMRTDVDDIVQRAALLLVLSIGAIVAVVKHRSCFILMS